jgi:hypothetical protein
MFGLYDMQKNYNIDPLRDKNPTLVIEKNKPAFAIAEDDQENIGLMGSLFSIDTK